MMYLCRCGAVGLFNQAVWYIIEEYAEATTWVGRTIKMDSVP